MVPRRYREFGCVQTLIWIKSQCQSEPAGALDRGPRGLYCPIPQPKSQESTVQTTCFVLEQQEIPTRGYNAVADRPKVN